MANVLIVDDAAFMRMSIRNILENNGFDVIAEASNGAEAIVQYLTHKPDLVTMDISMPVMEGLEAVKQICSKDKTAKIIMVSAMGQERIVREAIVSGAKSFILKPFKEAQVVETLTKIFNP